MSAGLRAGTNNDGYLQINGTDVLTALSSGNIGIGTTNPSAPLDIQSNWTNGATTNDIISIGRLLNAVKITAGYNDPTTSMYLGTSTSHALSLRTANTDRLTISNAGNVGIGTTNPLLKLDTRGALHVGGGTDGIWLGNVGDNSAYDNVKLYYTGYNGGGPRIYLTPRTQPGSGSLTTYLHLLSNNVPGPGANNMGLLVDGSVGIGTNSPQHKLHVVSGGIVGGSGRGGGFTKTLFESDAVTGAYWEFQTTPTSTINDILFSRGSTGNYGIVGYDNSVDKMRFYTASNWRMTIDSTGNVGIGVTNPDVKFHVNGVNAYPASSGSTPTGHISLRAKVDGSTHGLHIGVANVAPYGSWLQAQDANNLAVNYPISLNPNGGNVGIGTTNPSLGKLHIEGGSIFARKGSSSIMFDEYNNGSILWMDGSDGDMSGGDYWGIYAQSASQWGVNYGGGSNILNITATDSLVFTSASLCVATSTIKQKLTVNGDIGIYRGNGQTRVFTVKGGNGTFSTLTVTVNQNEFGCFVYDLKVHGYAGSYLHYAGGAYENGGIFNPVTTIAQKSASATFTGPTYVSGHTWTITVNWSNAWIHPVAEFSISAGGSANMSESNISMVWS